MKTNHVLIVAAAALAVWYFTRKPTEGASRPAGSAAFFGAPSWA